MPLASYGRSSKAVEAAGPKRPGKVISTFIPLGPGLDSFVFLTSHSYAIEGTHGQERGKAVAKSAGKFQNNQRA